MSFTVTVRINRWQGGPSPAPRPAIARLSLAFVLGVFSCASSATDVSTAPLSVSVKLVDAQGDPVAGLPLRISSPSLARWEAPDSGVAGVTDTRGVAELKLPGVLERTRIKRPTNFLSSLIACAEPADRVVVAVELRYLDAPWLHVYDLCRFGDGTMLMRGLDVRERDSTGRFVRSVAHDDRGWRFESLGGLVLTTPGFAIQSFDLSPDSGAEGQRSTWNVRLELRRDVAPARR